ncbi:MAG: hypothetical protein NTV33_12850 [Coprothermobacterota bacterium]|nr:hypothetical protein [Coprothermobacterota bacterium]
MRARGIKPGYFKNEGLASCSQAARLLFVGLWLLADREGRLEDRPKRIEAEIFPYEEVNVEELLDELAGNRDGNGPFIRRYVGEGHRYITIVNFLRHQYPHKNEQKSIIPAPPEVAPEQGRQENPEISGVDPVISGARPAVLLTADSLTPHSLTADSLTAVPLTPHSLGVKKARTAQKAATVRPCTPPSPQSVVSSEKKQDSILSAVEVYREITRLYPPKVIWSMVGEGVGSSPPELARWRETIIAWVGHGFKKTNVLGMLECFRRGELPGRDHHPPGNGTSGLARGSPPFLNRKAQAWANLQLDEESNPIGDVRILNRKAQAWADLKIEEEE